MEVASTPLEVEENPDISVVRNWRQFASHWDETDTVLVSDSQGTDYLLESPVYQLRNEGWCIVTLTYEQVSGSPVNFKIVDAESRTEVFHTSADSGTPCVARARVHASQASSVEFVIAQAEHIADEPLKISNLAVSIEEPEFLEDVPPVQAWTIANGRWVDAGRSIEHASTGSDYILHSPYFEISPSRRYIFALELDNDLRRNNVPEIEAALQFGLQDDVEGDWIESTKIQRTGRTRLIVSYVAKTAMSVRLVLAPISRSAGDPSRLNDIQFEMNVLSLSESFSSEDIDTYLENWGFIRRGIHRLCKRSKSFNTFVSALEMRLGREEVLSLPQYVGLCPTGQCNALCSFCSVTINRTGIIKRRLPFERVESFVAPVWNTARMFGLEGNGEPTLYPRFDDLYSMVTAHGASAYLITNGSRLKPQTIDLLQNRATDSINFSLNAATAETHREVMKLKNFEEILANIRRLVRERGVDEVNPHVSASFVVDNENVHEVVDFIDLAERDLKLDHIYVRPLSEIANDRGALEDHRDIVPYESDIQDMFDSVRDYLEDIPERTSILHFAPDTFRAVRPDPADRIVMPKGYEDALLAPRRQDWCEPAEGLDFRWFRNSLTLTTPNSANEGPLLESVPIPVEIGKRMEFSCDVKVNSGALRIAVLTLDGREIVGETIEASKDNTSHHYSWSVQSDDSDLVVISFQGCGTKLWAEIEFGRLRTPATGVVRDFKLPEPRRWMIDSPGAVTGWDGTKQFVSWAGKRGLYLVKSYSSPCLTDVALSLPISLEIRKGRLGIGILSEDQQNWVAQFEFDEDNRDEVLDIQTGDNHTLTVVLYSLSDAPLDVTIDWKSNLVSSPRDTEEAAGQQIREPVKEESAAATGADVQTLNATPKLITASEDEAPKATMSEPSPTESRADQPADAGISSDSQGDAARDIEKSQVPGKLASLLRYIRFGKTKYYCQKPWTDLGNFSVDGRVDVCCIATGPSQERFMLGNLLFQNFQEVWNGRMAREFRRTVNGDEPLPPCARCPMAYAYQGPLFDRQYTVNVVSSYLRWRTFLKRYVGKRGFGAVERGFIRPVCRIIGFLLFRGFKPIGEK